MPPIKSSYSNSSGACFELEARGPKVIVTDSKNRGQGPELKFTREEWLAFLKGCKAGEFDHLVEEPEQAGHLWT